MTPTDLITVALTCALFMGAVAWFSYQKARATTSDSEGYFLAGRGLSAPFIAGSLLLTNLSAEQLIGLNGSAYGFNMSAMGWEVTAAVATIAMAFFFLPRYLAGGFTTLPQFLADRYDDDVRRLSVILFLLGYGLVTIPSVLYAGSVAVLKLFDIPEFLGLSYGSSLVLTVIVIGSVGALYAVLGGLKAVAVSDTLNGLGLLIVGIAVPLLGLHLLGGDIASGVHIVTSTDVDKLNAIGDQDDPTPFGTLFTGMVFANLFYWCSNQYVIQRTLAAKSFAEGQKGVLLSGYFKVLVPFFMMVPGVIAYHLYGSGLDSIDLAYPQLVKDTLPTWALGFFLAVLLGAVFSSFNSLINSSATMLTLDVIQPLARQPIEDSRLVSIAKISSIGIAAVSLGIAPLLQFAPEGLWQIIRIFSGFYNIPIIAVVLVGMLTTRVPALAVKVAIGFHLIAYALLQFVFKDVINIHFLHLYAILFASEVAILLLIGHLRPAQVRSTTRSAPVDMTPWVFAKACSFSLFSCVVLLYMIFSPLGLAGGSGGLFATLTALLVVINILVWVRALAADKLRLQRQGVQ
ncbi:solute:sodium symporter family transporter [Luminiphilus sp.]|nr:solute:sodium symporter family transporter [Luminiphilus sp.]MDA9837795.1 solute:sodium symporter family transporter [Luminiphilus sp.]MDB2585575.1 solute:sodium symporter family transporter [Luminiphilus sp.]MDB2667503.1 solute:sodium symporter family transporter [Luminiphilus sp.]MDB3932861.1 solute:sodium symporter family transporter [Luminiphilus sp.]